MGATNYLLVDSDIMECNLKIVIILSKQICLVGMSVLVSDGLEAVSFKILCKNQNKNSLSLRLTLNIFCNYCNM